MSTKLVIYKDLTDTAFISKISNYQLCYISTELVSRLFDYPVHQIALNSILMRMAQFIVF